MQSYGVMCNGLVQGMFCSLPQREVTYGKTSNQTTERYSIYLGFLRGKGVAKMFYIKTVNVLGHAA